ncbi:MAG TPA: hypothetical protein PLQ93_11980 [Bacteroidia bacterium]|nr:hypothetical protein [Bacteroidia bacterium]
MDSYWQKLDKVWIGFLVGVLFPILMFFLYWLFFHHQIAFPMRFVKYLMNGYLLSGVIKMCGLGNLLIFYLGLNRKIDKFSKGIIVSVFIYLALVAYVTYYLEPDLN